MSGEDIDTKTTRLPRGESLISGNPRAHFFPGAVEAQVHDRFRSHRFAEIDLSARASFRGVFSERQPLRTKTQVNGSFEKRAEELLLFDWNRYGKAAALKFDPVPGTDKLSIEQVHRRTPDESGRVETVGSIEEIMRTMRWPIVFSSTWSCVT